MGETIQAINEVDNVVLRTTAFTGYNGRPYSYDTKGDGFEIVTDKQRILLGIENGQSCCEDWGYFMSEDDVQSFVGAELLNVTLTDTVLNTKKLHETFGDPNDTWSEGGTMFVNIETNRGTLQFVAYNSHNGYYGHTAIVSSEQLNHEEGL